jgi:hypothetical protein
MRWAVLASVVTASVLTSVSAHADPQWNASTLAGVCGRGADGSLWDDTCFYTGARADVLFARNRNSDFAIGPYLDVNTAAFDDIRLGGGPSFLMPVHPYFPLVLSAGPFVRHDEKWTPGVEGWLFFGSRSYNFHSAYSLAGGLVFGYQTELRDQKSNAIVIAAQIDVLFVVLPFIAGYQWISGGPATEDD